MIRLVGRRVVYKEVIQPVEVIKQVRCTNVARACLYKIGQMVFELDSHTLVCMFVCGRVEACITSLPALSAICAPPSLCSCTASESLVMAMKQVEVPMFVETYVEKLVPTAAQPSCKTLNACLCFSVCFCGENGGIVGGQGKSAY